MSVLSIVALVATACTPTASGDSATNTSRPDSSTTLPLPGTQPAPEVPTGPLAESAIADLDLVFDSTSGSLDLDAVRRLADSADPRISWLLADLLRFLPPGPASDEILLVFESLTGFEADSRSPWVDTTNALITWDTPAPPDYVRWKGQLFVGIDERWEYLFTDPSATLDYRLLSWGGVRPDDRPLGDSDPCPRGCIPALDDPAVTDAAGGDWYPDDAVVFGLTLNGESRAYPKNIMEIHEMVIDTVGGVRIGMPYCTLCGSAQAYDLASVPDGVEQPLLRTSGLLVRSNKLMYDLNSLSAFDTFTGEALSGPMRVADVNLAQLTVVTSTWGDWKTAHPGTSIIAQDGGIGRRYALDPLNGRDDNGPIFPIGAVDARLPVQAPVVGVETTDRTYVAFSVVDAKLALADGQPVELGGVTLENDAGGFRAFEDGIEVPTHQAFWFAWSQFHPSTELWQPGLPG